MSKKTITWYITRDIDRDGKASRHVELWDTLPKCKLESSRFAYIGESKRASWEGRGTQSSLEYFPARDCKNKYGVSLTELGSGAEGIIAIKVTMETIAKKKQKKT